MGERKLVGDEIVAWARENFYFVLMAAGALVAVGAALDWKWISRIESGWTMPFIRAWIEARGGVEARYRFERWFMFAVGVLLFAAGGVFWWLLG